MFSLALRCLTGADNPDVLVAVYMGDDQNPAGARQQRLRCRRCSSRLPRAPAKGVRLLHPGWVCGTSIASRGISRPSISQPFRSQPRTALAALTFQRANAPSPNNGAASAEINPMEAATTRWSCMLLSPSQPNSPTSRPGSTLAGCRKMCATTGRGRPRRMDRSSSKVANCSRMNEALPCRGVAQPGSAPALCARNSTPTAPSTTLSSLCFQ